MKVPGAVITEHRVRVEEIPDREAGGMVRASCACGWETFGWARDVDTEADEHAMDPDTETPSEGDV